jgi:hypothetical protein
MNRKVTTVVTLKSQPVSGSIQEGPPLSFKNPPTFDPPRKTFPGRPSRHRSVQQIDLVLTLLLLLGLPIPFNDLEMIMSELFW